jgi:hypothetical protein
MKTEQTYKVNMDVLSTTMRDARMDADPYFVARQLEYIVPVSYELAKHPLNASLLIPTDSTIPAYAEQFTWYQHSGDGIAKIVTDLSDDLPIVNKNTVSFNQLVKTIGSAYTVTVDELAAAQFNNAPLNTLRAEEAVTSIMQEMNKLAFAGNTKFNLKGWFTGATQVQVATGVGGRPWAGKTPDEILKDLNGAMNEILIGTNGVEMPNTIAISPAAHTIIAQTARGVSSDTTIKQFFLENNPNVKIVSAPELTGAFTGGADGFIVYDFNRSKFYQEIPLYPEASQPQPRNYSFVVNYRAKFGGVVMIKPKSQAFRYGI